MAPNRNSNVSYSGVTIDEPSGQAIIKSCREVVKKVLTAGSGETKELPFSLANASFGPWNLSSLSSDW
jgi:hypothetical protein